MPASAQTNAPNEWTWTGGSSSFGQPGVYGTLGTSAAGNTPGCLDGAASSTDGLGDLWLFGGEGCDASGQYILLNDLWLWQIDYFTNAWSWVWLSGSSTINCPAEPCGPSGVYGTLGQPASGNVPGGRLGASSWIDDYGNFWLFGGQGYDANGNNVTINDLWEFSPSAMEWTWMGGSETGSGFGYPGVYGTLETPNSANYPGSRSTANSWTENGSFGSHLWLFGGFGVDASGNPGSLNDLWEFDTSTKEWTWMGGSSILTSPYGNPGIYGSMGVPASGNIPGGRSGASSWIDGRGYFWLFGGEGSDSVTASLYLNDLWMFIPSSNEWAWEGGNSTASSSSSGPVGVYGTLGIHAGGNTPGGRVAPAVWADTSGNLWLFGGFGVFASGAGDWAYFNDLWEFDTSNNEWAWMGGSNTVPGVSEGNPGTYGVLGVPNAGNIPGGRNGSASWTDRSGNLWLFGGTGVGNFNDLWEYQPYPNAATPTFSVAAGTYPSAQTVTISDSTPGSTICCTDNGWAPTIGCTIYTGPISVSSSETIDAVATATGHTTSAIATAAYTIAPPADTPSFSVPAGTYTTPQPVTISDTTSGATIYYTTNGTMPTTSSTVYSGPITVSSTETIEAVATATGDSTSAVATASYNINLPTAATPTFSVAAGTYASAQTVAISDTATGATIYYTTDGTTPTTSSTVYSGPILVSSTEAIQAIATASGDSPSAVASATYTIPPGFTLSLSPTSLTVQAGQSGTTTITMTDEGGFNSNVSFACSGLPTGAACSFALQTVPTPAGVTYTTLTVTTGATSAALHRRDSSLLPEAALSVAFCCFGLRKRRRVQFLLLLAASAAGLGLLTACGGAGSSGGGSGGSQPVTSTVTITATSGALQNTMTFTLTVN